MHVLFVLRSRIRAFRELREIRDAPQLEYTFWRGGMLVGEAALERPAGQADNFVDACRSTDVARDVLMGYSQGLVETSDVQRAIDGAAPRSERPRSVTPGSYVTDTQRTQMYTVFPVSGWNR
jgi:hypothetical protein